MRTQTVVLVVAGALGAALIAWSVLRPTVPEGAYAFFSYDSLDDEQFGEMRYAIFVPPVSRKEDKVPLIVFLHGPKLSGADGRRQLTEGLGPIVASRVRAGKPMNSIVLFPQSYSGEWEPESEDGKLLMKVLDKIQERYPIDVNRIYLTGVEDGASALWRLAMKYPHEWAAIVPVGGVPDPAYAASVKHVPCWYFCGGAQNIDTDAPRSMVAALRGAGGDPRYTEFPVTEQNMSMAAYGYPQLIEWLLTQRRPSESQSVPVDVPRSSSTR